ncbi:MAG TPA: hypothetical protein VG935_02715 [Patescibacteria group bacterium]|nr:hypothetical protein [Patescibacteria group bacterium]
MVTSECTNYDISPVYLRNTQENIDLLKDEFADSPDNLFVRGSFARGDRPFGDIDISAYNPGGTYRGGTYPSTFEGIPISYGQLPLEKLEDYFQTCLRGTSSLMETLPIKVVDPLPLDIIERQKAEFIATRIPDYLLFLQVEEKIAREDPGKNEKDIYYYRKREGGSKRSISRMVWTIKGLYPELFAISNTTEALDKIEEQKMIPNEIVNATRVIANLVSRDFVDPTVWEQNTTLIKEWIDTVLNPCVKRYIGHHIPAGLVNATDIATDPTAGNDELERAFNYAQGEPVAHRQWLAMFALAKNPSLPKELLSAILDQHKGTFSYRNVIRNLLRNPSFPISQIEIGDLSHDPYAQFLLKQRQIKTS